MIADQAVFMDAVKPVTKSASDICVVVVLTFASTTIFFKLWMRFPECITDLSDCVVHVFDFACVDKDVVEAIAAGWAIASLEIKQQRGDRYQLLPAWIEHV
jgi:hypothetical protein